MTSKSSKIFVLSLLLASVLYVYISKIIKTGTFDLLLSLALLINVYFFYYAIKKENKSKWNIMSISFIINFEQKNNRKEVVKPLSF